MRTFLKQLAASIICITIIYFMSSSEIGFFTNCTTALGKAIRYEPDFNVIWQDTTNWIGGFFSDN